MTALLQAFLGALFQNVVNWLNARQHDADLKDLGYTQSQRDVVVEDARRIDAASAARARAALDRVLNPGGLRAPDKYARRSPGPVDPVQR